MLFFENYTKDMTRINKHTSTYLIPTVLDIPERYRINNIGVSDPIGPWGARGVGEMPYLPLTPAITAALHSATGVWFNEFPYTPERILFGLAPGLAE